MNLPKEPTKKEKIAIINTGGTIGCITTDGVRHQPKKYRTFENYVRDLTNVKKGIWSIFEGKIDFEYLELTQEEITIEEEQKQTFDSAILEAVHWIKLGERLRKLLHKYRGFVITHGTDTLAYTAAAITFLTRHLGVPIILTASQIPLMDEVDSDGLSNLWGACVLAYRPKMLGQKEVVIPLIPEVCVYFNRKIMQGTRVLKIDANGVDAFDTPRAPLFGTYTSQGTFDFNHMLINHICHKRKYKAIEYHKLHILESGGEVVALRRKEPQFARVSMIHFYPNFDKRLVEFTINCMAKDPIEFDHQNDADPCLNHPADEFPTSPAKPLSVQFNDLESDEEAVRETPGKDAFLEVKGGIVLRSYGAGNGPDLEKELDLAESVGVMVVNCTECQRGNVVPTYETSKGLSKAANLEDMTPETAFAKLWVFINYKYSDKENWEYTIQNLRLKLLQSWRGEKIKDKEPEKSFTTNLTKKL